MAERKRSAVTGRWEKTKPEVAKVETKLSPPRKASECGKYMRERLVEGFVGIADGFVQEATAGSCAHLKMANELLKAEPGKRRKKGPVERTLEMLRRS